MTAFSPRLLTLAVLTLAHVPAALADEESIVHAMEVYDGADCDNELGNPGNLIYSIEMGAAWKNEITTWGTFEVNSSLPNSDPEGEDMEDPQLDVADGTDDQTVPMEGIDSHDVAYVISHGNHTCDDQALRYETVFGYADTDGTITDDCRPQTDEDIFFGDTDLNIFYSASCSSSHYCVWEADGYDGLDSGNFALWAGFHGINTDGPFIDLAVTDFVSGSRTSGAGSNWIAEMNNIRIGVNDDDCATVVVWGSSTTNTDNFYNNAGIEDFAVSVGTHTMNAIYYIDGCDSFDGAEL